MKKCSNVGIFFTISISIMLVIFGLAIYGYIDYKDCSKITCDDYWMLALSTITILISGMFLCILFLMMILCFKTLEV